MKILELNDEDWEWLSVVVAFEERTGTYHPDSKPKSLVLDEDGLLIPTKELKE